MNLEKIVEYGGEITLKVRDKIFAVKPLTLQQIITGEFKESGLIAPREKDRPGQFQFLNVQGEERSKQIDKWMQKTISHNGEPVTLQQACEMGWDIVDLGRWLDLLVQISG